MALGGTVPTPPAPSPPPQQQLERQGPSTSLQVSTVLVPGPPSSTDPRTWVMVNVPESSTQAEEQCAPSRTSRGSGSPVSSSLPAIPPQFCSHSATRSGAPSLMLSF